MMGIRLRNEIAQLQLSDFWRGIHALRKTSFLHQQIESRYGSGEIR